MKLDVNKTERSKCNGLVFRGYSSRFFDFKSKRLEKKEGFRLLKRESCKGCQFCGFYFDDIDIMLEQDQIIFPKEIKSECLYGIKVVNEERDWESGQIDGWDYEIYEIE